MADSRASLYGLGRQSQAYVVAESTFGTQLVPAATNAFRFLSGGPKDPKPERIDVDEHRDSRSRIARYTGMTPPTAWDFTSLLRPVASPGSGGNGPPDVHAFINAAMGSYTQNAADETYALSDTQADMGSLCIYKMVPPPVTGVKDMMLGRAASGAVVDEMEIAFSATAAPTIRFAGTAKRCAFTSRTTTAGAESGSTVAVTDPASVPVGSLIAFYEASDGSTVLPDAGGDKTGDNDGAGFLVTANDGTSITVDSSIPTSHDSGDVVAPWSPTESGLQGNPVSPYIGSLTIAGVTVRPLEGAVLLRNNHSMWDDEVFQQEATGFHSNWRDAEFRTKFRASSTLLELLSRRADFASITSTIVIGQSSGGICTVTFKGEMTHEDTEEAQDNTVVANVTFKGTASSSTAADEVGVVFT